MKNTKLKHDYESESIEQNRLSHSHTFLGEIRKKASGKKEEMKYKLSLWRKKQNCSSVLIMLFFFFFFWFSCFFFSVRWALLICFHRNSEKTTLSSSIPRTINMHSSLNHDPTIFKCFFFCFASFVVECFSCASFPFHLCEWG